MERWERMGSGLQCRAVCFEIDILTTPFATVNLIAQTCLLHNVAHVTCACCTLSLVKPVQYVICPLPLMLRCRCTVQLTCSMGRAGQRMPLEPYGATQGAGTGSASTVMVPHWCKTGWEKPAIRCKLWARQFLRPVQVATNWDT